MHDAALDVEFTVEPIHIRPLERKRLTNTKAEAHAHKRNRVEWFLKLLCKPLKLFHGQATWLPRALRCALDGDKFHRIPLYWHVTPPHCEVPKSTDKAANVNLALGC